MSWRSLAPAMIALTGVTPRNGSQRLARLEFCADSVRRNEPEGFATSEEFLCHV